MSDNAKKNSLYHAWFQNVVCTKCGAGKYLVPHFKLKTASGSVTVGTCKTAWFVNQAGIKLPKITEFTNAADYQNKLLERASEHGPTTKPMELSPVPFKSGNIIAAIGAKSGMKRLASSFTTGERIEVPDMNDCWVPREKMTGIATFAKVVVLDKLTKKAATSSEQKLEKINIEYFRSAKKSGLTYKCASPNPQDCHKYTQCCAKLQGSVLDNLNNQDSDKYKKTCFVDMDKAEAYGKKNAKWQDMLEDLENAMTMFRLVI